MKNIFRFLRSGGFLFLVLYLFTGTNPLHAQWIQTNGLYGRYVSSLAVSGTNLFAGTYTPDGGVFRSNNNGISWTPASTGLPNPINVYDFAVSGTNLFAGTGSGVFLSTNDGTSWTEASTGLPKNYPAVQALAVTGTNLFAACNYSVFRSTNNGTSWTEVNSGLPNAAVWAFAVSGTNLFAGTYGFGVFLSTNGTSWTAVNTGLPTSSYVNAFAVTGTNLFAAIHTSQGHRGVFLSTNNGTSWTEANTGLMDLVMNALAPDLSGKLFAGTGGRVFFSTNNGTSWTEASTGLPNNDVVAFAVSFTNLFAGIYGSGVWRRPLSEMITSVERLPTDLPTHFSLHQNYPNPFNPATTISFGLPSQSFVSLKVFDALGKEVAVLVSEELSAGTYSQQWNAEGLSSGVYFYRLEAGAYIQTKKLLLLR